MEVIGKIIHVLPEVSGTSKAGNPWKKREYVLETQETYPKKIHFDFFGDKADQFPLQGGQTIKLSFDIDSHEYNGRWFTSIRGWKAEDVNTNAPINPTPTQVPDDPFGSTPPSTDFMVSESSPSDDLPF